MLKEINNQKYDIVICYRLDRISRDISDFSNMMNSFGKMNVSFVSTRDNFDTSTPMGKAMMYIVSVFAQLERDTIAERIRDNMHELAKTGRWLGGTTPIGYKSKKLESLNIDGKKRSSFMLEIIDDEMSISKLIYKKFLETNSLTQTELFLMKKNIKTRNGKFFSRFAIRSILENPVYMIADIDAWNYFEELEVDIHSNKEEFNGECGIMAYNKTKQTVGKTNIKNNVNEWIVAVGKHQGVILGKDWIKVQKMLEQNKSKSFRKPRSNIALLSGVLICGDCGSYMRPKQSNRRNKDNERIFHYLCEKKEKSQKLFCDCKNINGNTLDKLVCDEVKKLSEDNEHFLHLLEKAKKEFSKSSDNYEKTIKQLEKNIKKNETSIQNYIRALGENEEDISKEYINKEIKRLHNENEVINAKIDEINILMNNCEYSESDFDVISSMVSSFAKTVDMMTIEEKRNTIRMLIKRVVWDGEKVHIYFMGSDSDNDNIPIITATQDEEMLPLGKDSKRNTYVDEGTEENSRGCFAERDYRNGQRRKSDYAY